MGGGWKGLRVLVLFHVLARASAGGTVSINVKDLGAIEGIQSLDIRGSKQLALYNVYAWGTERTAPCLPYKVLPVAPRPVECMVMQPMPYKWKPTYTSVQLLMQLRGVFGEVKYRTAVLRTACGSCVAEQAPRSRVGGD